MRLTCPNCGAQYEVPDEVIPPEGRDVQCSNCGDTWYHYHPDFPPAEAEPEQSDDDQDFEIEEPSDEDLRAALTEGSRDRARTRIQKPTRPRPEPEPEPEPEFEPEQDTDYDEDDDFEDGPAEQPAQGQRQLDNAVSDILREEAERETRLRAGEAGLESQPDLGLDSQPDAPSNKRAEEARDRMARMRGEPAPSEQIASDAHRRELLPDIEEINSSLRGSDNAVIRHSPTQEAPVAEPRKRGFSRGFSVAVILAVILTILYARSQQIAQAVPQADPMLSAYVALVDQGRLWLDQQVGRFAPPPQQ